MTEHDFEIDASTKVAALLDRYPELEDTLIELSPAFRKLKNPALRRSVAKVASLGQAAAVAGLRTHDLVNRLRRAVGQPEATDLGEGPSPGSYLTERPEWFDRSQIVASIDDRTAPSDTETMPLVNLYERAQRLGHAEIVELVTTHLPVPGIDIMRKRGFLSWSVEEQPDLVRTYFRKR